MAAILALLPIVGYTISALSFLAVMLSGFDLHNAVIRRVSDLALTLSTRMALPFLIVDMTVLLMLKNTDPADKRHRTIKVATAAGLLLSIVILIVIVYLLLTGPSIHDLPDQ